MRSGNLYESKENFEREIAVGKILSVARPVGIGLRKIGIVVVSLAIGVATWVYEPLMRVEIQYQRDKQIANSDLQTIKDIQVPASSNSNEYKIYIPQIGAEAKVVPNIDAFDNKIYSKALLEGVAEASNLSHPGEMGTTFLFAHSVGSRVDYARYNAVFFLLNKLEKGDEIYIDYEGNKYTYKVDKKEVLAASDLKYFEDQKQEEMLVLQTCYPPGTSWKRLVVIGKRSY